MQVGTRVRVAKYAGYEAYELAIGATGTVGQIVSDELVRVFIDGYREPIFNPGGWAYPVDTLEVIE